MGQIADRYSRRVSKCGPASAEHVTKAVLLLRTTVQHRILQMMTETPFVRRRQWYRDESEGRMLRAVRARYGVLAGDLGTTVTIDFNEDVARHAAIRLKMTGQSTRSGSVFRGQRVPPYNKSLGMGAYIKLHCDYPLRSMARKMHKQILEVP